MKGKLLTTTAVAVCVGLVGCAHRPIAERPIGLQVRYYVSNLKSEDREERRKSEGWLAQHGAESVQELVKGLTDANFTLRLRSAILLQSLCDDPAARDVMKKKVNEIRNAEELDPDEVLRDMLRRLLAKLE